MLKYKALSILRKAKFGLLLSCLFLLGNTYGFANTIVDAAGVYTSIDVDRIALKVAEVETFHNIEIDVVTCTSALPQVGFVVSSSGLTGRKLLINIPAGVDVAGIQVSQDIADVFPVSSLERISEHVLRPLVESRDYCLATLETLAALLNVSFQIKSLSFIESVRIKDIPHDLPEWVYEENVEISKPIAYAFTDKVKVKPLIEAVGRPNGSIINLIAKRRDETVSHQGVVENGSVVFQEEDVFEFSPPLNNVGYVESFDIDWYLEIPSSGLTNRLLTSRNEMFITLRKPPPVLQFVEMEVFLLNFGCKQGEGSATQEDFIKKIWSRFTTRRLKLSMFKDVEEDGVLTYYDKPDVDVSGLDIISYNKLDGQCGAFTKILENTLTAQGISHDRNYIDPALGLNDDGNGELILVKNWDFVSPPAFPNSYYTHFNQIKGLKPEGQLTVADMRIERTANGSIYEFLESPQVVKADGLPGQGVSTPYADFGSHYNSVIGEVIYDASYGKKFLSKKEFEESSIDAFYVIQVNADPVSGDEYYYMYIRKNKSDVDDLDYE